MCNDMYYLTVISGPVMVKYSVNCESQWRCITQTCSCGRREADYQKPSHPLAAHMLTAHPSSYCCAWDKISLFWQCYQTSQSILERQVIQQSHRFPLKSITKTTRKESQSWTSHRQLLLNIYGNSKIPRIQKVADKNLHHFYGYGAELQPRRRNGCAIAF